MLYVPRMSQPDMHLASFIWENTIQRCFLFIIIRLLTYFTCLGIAYARYAFGVAAARVWNSLPPVVTSASSLPSFKRQLKKNLFFQNSFPYL